MEGRIQVDEIAHPTAQMGHCILKKGWIYNFAILKDEGKH
jgi:hypothetical protein